MSWFSNLNVNESLNTLKGQITNVSNAVHDVLNETIVEREEPNVSLGGGDDEVLIGLETANKRIDDLNGLCETKDTEVGARQFIVFFFEIYRIFVRVLESNFESKSAAQIEFIGSLKKPVCRPQCEHMPSISKHAN